MSDTWEAELEQRALKALSELEMILLSMAYGQLFKTPFEECEETLQRCLTENERLVADERLYNRESIDFSYFVDFDAYPNTLLMVKRDGSNELVKRLDDRFNFHE